MCVPLRNFEVLIVIIKKLDNGRKETTNHLVIYALQEGNSEGGGGGGGERGEGKLLYEEAPPERGAIFRLQVLGVGISLLEVYEQDMKLRRKSVNFVCKKAQNG